MSIVKKVAIICSVPIFYWFGWIVAVLTFSLVGVLKHLGYVYWQIFLILWIGNTLLSERIIFATDKTSIDFTLMNNIEKMFFNLKQKNCFLKIASVFFGTCWIVWNAFWTGPAEVFLLLRRNVWVYNNKWIVLIAVSALQMALWTEVYSVGYDNVMPILQQLMAGYI